MKIRGNKEHRCLQPLYETSVLREAHKILNNTTVLSSGRRSRMLGQKFIHSILHQNINPPVMLRVKFLNSENLGKLFKSIFHYETSSAGLNWCYQHIK